MRRNICRLVFISIISLCSGCVSIVRIDGPYEGRVVDAETNKPIVGAVVHGTWSKAHPTPAGSSSTFYDSYEVLTDNNGEFKIPGQGLLVLSQVEEMDVTILKAGYEEFEDLWVGLKDWGPDGKVTWQGNKVTIKLRRMTLEERRMRVISFPNTDSRKKERLLRIESNKENTEIGQTSAILPVE